MRPFSGRTKTSFCPFLPVSGRQTRTTACKLLPSAAHRATVQWLPLYLMAQSRGRRRDPRPRDPDPSNRSNGSTGSRPRDSRRGVLDSPRTIDFYRFSDPLFEYFGTLFEYFGTRKGQLLSTDAAPQPAEILALHALRLAQFDIL